MRDMVVVSARVPVDVADEIEALAVEPGDMSRFIRGAIMRALRERERRRQRRAGAHVADATEQPEAA
jgi:hypothetical protein